MLSWYNKPNEKYSHLYRYEIMIQSAELQKDFKVVDIGGGSGYLSLLCARNGCITYHIDIDSDLVYLARENTRKHGINEVNYIRATAENLRFMREKVDVVFCGEVLEHLPNDELAIREISRIIKPSGKFIITTPNCNALPYVLLRVLPGSLRKLVLKVFRVDERFLGELIGEKIKLRTHRGHVRCGYSKKEIEFKLISNGFSIEKWIRFGFLIPRIIVSKLPRVLFRLLYNLGTILSPIAHEHLIIAKKSNALNSKPATKILFKRFNC